MVVNSTTLEMRSMWHTDQKTLDWSILSLKELETRVQHHNFRKSTWKTTPFFLEATFIIKCPRTWKCSCQLVMLLRFCQRCAKKKVAYKNNLWWSLNSHFLKWNLQQKQSVLNLQPSVWVWTHKAVKISAFSFKFFIHHVPVHCPPL